MEKYTWTRKSWENIKFVFTLDRTLIFPSAHVHAKRVWTKYKFPIRITPVVQILKILLNKFIKYINTSMNKEINK